MDNDKSIKTLTRSKLRPFWYHPNKFKENLKENFTNIIDTLSISVVFTTIMIILLVELNKSQIYNY